MKKVKYIYRRRSETLSEAFYTYSTNLSKMYEDRKECLEWIEQDKLAGFIGKTSKPILVKITIEELDL